MDLSEGEEAICKLLLKGKPSFFPLQRFKQRWCDCRMIREPRVYQPSQYDRLDGVVLINFMASASRAEDPGYKSRLQRDFSGSSHTSDSKTGTPVATLTGAWRSRTSTRTDVSIL